MVAAYRSIFDYFLRKKFSWDEIDEFVGYRDGKAAWTVQALTKMVDMGFDIAMIEPFDYRTYAERGEAYLHDRYPVEQVEWMLKKSNVLSFRPLIPAFLEKVHWKYRQAQLADIDRLLSEDRLVFVTLNALKLNGKPGYSAHAVLIIGRESDEYVIHDSGLPPRPGRRVSRTVLWEAMGGAKNTSEVTGFKLATAIGKRLDQYVIHEKPRLSRAYASRLITEGRVLVNGKPGKAGYKVKYDDVVHIDYDDAELDAIPRIDLPILYEDDTCVVINKPVGILVHGKGTLDTEATVATWLRDRLHENMEGQRGGIVHRLDRATSGVLVCAKTPAALSWFQKQFAARTVQKTYFAVVKGHMPHEHAVIDMPILRNAQRPQVFHANAQGKPATTDYWVMGRNDTYSLLKLQPHTGRTHQLRVHLGTLGHPIVGDELYGGEPADRLYLHAEQLELTLPNGTRMTFQASLPPEFKAKVR